MKKFVFSLISSLIIIYSVQAQYDAQFSQNMNCLSMYNPAMISINGYANVVGINRQQWVGLENYPLTYVFNVSFPFQLEKSRQAVGLLILEDKFGLFANQSRYLQYAYQKKMLQGMFGVGANLGFLSNSFDGTQVFIPESDYHVSNDDALVPTTDEKSRMVFDLALGVSYYDEKKYAGISLYHITKPTIDIGEKASVSIKPLLNFTTGYNFILPNALYSLKPSLYLKSDFASFQVDVNTIVEYNKRFWGGISYRYQDAVVLLIGLKMSNGMNVGYSYDITTSKLARVSSGSHEVMISYDFKLDFSEKNKYKSIRIL